jgi:tripartite ATP-independent transporter DctM subunit
MIPPSLTFVIYAMITEQSVGRLLMAGIVPGLISAALYAAAVLVLVRLRPSLAPERETRRIPLSERLGSFSGVWAMFLIVVLVLGGLYAGLFPPSGAGAVGAAGTFLLALARLGPRKGWISESLARSASISCQLFAIILGGLIFSRFLVVTGSVGAIADGLSSLVGSSLGLVVVLSLMYLLLGCFMDTASMMIVTLPIVFPLVGEFGLDPIWFGVVFVKLIEIAVITPPVGLNLFAALSASGRYADYRDIVAGVAPFLVADGAALVLLIAFPGLSTWLPERMF